jgi:hypothetical protein
MTNNFRSLCAALLALCAASLPARANDVPASLLVFPLYDNAPSAFTLITVANSSSSNGNIRVEFVYINSVNCLETNLMRTLTPRDTFTALTKVDNPNAGQGYVYVFARNAQGQATKFDHLVGLEEVIDGARLDLYQIKPYGFLAGAALAQGANTDVNFNGRRDLNGTEYQPAPNTLVSPRFLGQPGANGTSDLVLINLTGGGAFTATLGFLVYNDQEDAFSASYQFRCWARVPLSTISGAFNQSFLAGTNSNSENVLGLYESGLYVLGGLSASSQSTSLGDPAILAMQVDRGLFGIGSAFLPYCVGTQNNGSLLAHGPTGN